LWVEEPLPILKLEWNPKFAKEPLRGKIREGIKPKFLPQEGFQNNKKGGNNPPKGFAPFGFLSP